MKVFVMIGICLALTAAACGDDVNTKGNATSSPVNISSNSGNGQTVNSGNGQTVNNGAVEPREVRAECSEELLRLEGCGLATSEEREILEGMLCSSTEFTDGQVASVVDCLSQWECGGAEPACLADSSPAPECSTNSECEANEVCLNGVCQPPNVDADCELLVFDVKNRCGGVEDNGLQICAAEQPSLDCTLCITTEECDQLVNGVCNEFCID